MSNKANGDAQTGDALNAVWLGGQASNFWHNIGTQAQVPKNANFNDYKTPGNYGISSAEVAQTIMNFPRMISSGSLEVSYAAGLWHGPILQKFKPWGGSAGYHRAFNGTTWLDWIETATTESAELVLLNGWKYSDDHPGYQPVACRCGNLVVVSGVIIGGVVDFNTIICVLPSKFTPTKSSHQIIFCTNGTHLSITVTTTGEVRITTSPPVGNRVHFNFSFCI